MLRNSKYFKVKINSKNCYINNYQLQDMHFRRLIASNWIFFVLGRTSNPTFNKCPSMIDEIHFLNSIIFLFIFSFFLLVSNIKRPSNILFQTRNIFSAYSTDTKLQFLIFERKLIYFCWRLLEKRYFYCSSRVFVCNNCHIKLCYNDYRFLSLKIETSY